MSRNTQKRVAILIESTRSYSRDVILGVAEYQKEHRNWEIEFSPRGFDEPIPDWLKSWNGDGVLARINDRRMLQILLSKKVPIIDLRRFLEHRSIPQIGPNDRQAVEMVFEHFWQRGFRRFAFVGPAPEAHPTLDRRFSSFHDLVRSKESELTVIRLEEKSGSRRRIQTRLRRGIQKLESGTAILAANDDWGLSVLEACRYLDRSVPYDLLVAGIGNDRCLCELALPTLTSVDLNPKHIGYTAARILQKMMAKPGFRPEDTLIEPRYVIERSSTDMVAVEDRYVRSAVQFIRSNFGKKIDAHDVVKHAHLCRMALENRFKKSLGHSIYREIMQVRLEAIKDRLAKTDMTLKEIARETGFSDPMYMIRVFGKMTGETVKEYRQRMQRGKF